MHLNPTKDIRSLHHFGKERHFQRSDPQHLGQVARELLRKAGKPKLMPRFKFKNFVNRLETDLPLRTSVRSSLSTDDATASTADSQARPLRSTTADSDITTVPSLATSTKSADTSFTPLPPLLSVLETGSATVSLRPIMTITVTAYESPSATSAGQQTQCMSSHAISTAVITLLAVGSVFVFIGVFIVFRVCSRPRKRTHPTPSLPILKEEFQNQFTCDDSPLFGGKERYSSDARESTVAWPPHQEQRTETVRTSESTRPPQNLVQSDPSSHRKNDPGQVPVSVPKDTQRPQRPAASSKSVNRSPARHSQNAMPRAVSRLSTSSVVLYPDSTVNVGIAVVGSPSMTTEDYAEFKGKRPKTAKQRDRLSLGAPETESWRCSQGLAYEMGSPIPASRSIPAIKAAASGGRTRVKSSYYGPAAYPRYPRHIPLSSVPISPGLHGADADNDVDAELRRHRETQALTSALGLSSPNPTIYPDESLSRRPSVKTNAGHSKRKPPGKFTTPVKVIMSPSSDTSAALGSLMLMDYGVTSKSVPALGHLTEPITPSASIYSISGITKGGNSKKSMNDKPPRVPSPPPMPSLAQMALAHANPESYADYRSPTYSIYGLYQAERKSRVTSFGY